MYWYQSILYLIVSFGASVIGAVCGIGGGVIIKPVLDSFGWASVSTISFLSGCTVLSMSCYSVIRAMLDSERYVRLKTGTPLALGASIGGLAGKQLFIVIKEFSASPDTVGAVQAICLAAITVGTLMYTVKRNKNTQPKEVSTVLCICIGLVLGVFSSFLGIGGGPINLAVLYFFFGMDTKTAAANSLYIILFSQITSLLTTLFTATVPEFSGLTLSLMVFGGISGGIVGRQVNKRIDNAAVERLFTGLMVLIICISIYNAWKYLHIT